MNIAAIIIAKNEAVHITRCVHSVAFADEILLIDSGSTDHTPTLAAQAGARVITHEWPGYGAQKNFGAAQTSCEWLLFIDADEEVSPILADEIQAATTSGKRNFYWLVIETIFMRRPLRHLRGHNVRLYRRSVGSWTTGAVHEQVQTASGRPLKLTDAESAVLTSPLVHHSHSTIGSYLTTMHGYTTLDAAQMLSSMRHRSGRLIRVTFWQPWYQASRQLLKLLFYRRGIFDGWAGIVWCFLSAYYEWEMTWKFLTLYKQKQKKL